MPARSSPTPLPLALIALLLGGEQAALALVAAALACRGAPDLAIERGYGLPPHPYWLIPVRDLLSFAVFVAGFRRPRRDAGRGTAYALMSEGTYLNDSERRPPSP